MTRSIHAFAVLLVLLWANLAHATTTIILTRHAEKDASISGTSQPLSDAGQSRAQQLSQTLADIPLQAVYASTGQHDGKVTAITRTWDTAQPVADQHQLHNQGYTATDYTSLTSHILENNRDQAVLVVGHSNTVPEIIRALGVETDLTLTDDDYDDLFIVTIDDAGNATLLHLHYGNPTP